LRAFAATGIFALRVGGGPLFIVCMETELEGQLRCLISELAACHGLELVEVQYTPRGPRHRLKVLLDRKGGVTIGECARFSRGLSRSLDRRDLFPHSYVLEVSSPGVGRLLRTEQDFARVEGRKVRMRMQGGEVIVGVVKSASDGTVTLQLADGSFHLADLLKLQHARADVSLKKR
jgi:ribosome maturation factor RimP